MAPKINRQKSLSTGFTLLELLLVIAMIGVLTTMAVWGSQQMNRKWQLRRAGHQLHEALKSVQAKAEMSGGLTLGSSSLIQQRTFVVFEEGIGSYAVVLWRDNNSDGIAAAGETILQSRSHLPPGISYAWGQGVDRRACSNVNNPPGKAVSFASPDYPPCNDQPCLKFDHNGFSVLGPGAIYLSDGRQSLAITATRPGHFTMCEWNGERWQ